MRSVKQRFLPDWLREQRLELGQSPEPVVHAPLGLLLVKGAVLGVVLVLTPLALLSFLNRQQRGLERQVRDLVPLELRLGDAQVRLQAMAKERASLTQQTSRIAAQLVALRSGSALLEQMRQATPQGVRLLSLAALPSKLVIKGEAQGTDAYERINALALNLERLDDFLVDGTTVVKATANENGLIDFSMESVLDPSAQVTPERLRGLGADGLARRYELLQQSGIAL